MNEMLMLADTATQVGTDKVSPAFMGMVVIILLQLSQFFFAWRKDMRANDSVRKADLDKLREDLMGEIDDVGDELKKFKETSEHRHEEMRKEHLRAQGEIHTRITESALKLSALVAGQESVNQSVIALGTKVDRMMIPAPKPPR